MASFQLDQHLFIVKGTPDLNKSCHNPLPMLLVEHRRPEVGGLLLAGGVHLARWFRLGLPVKVKARSNAKYNSSRDGPSCRWS